MSRKTSLGKASVTLLCEAFGISRAAYYEKPKRTKKVVSLPRRPEYAPSEQVLAAIREVLAREPAWGVRKAWAAVRRTGLVVSYKRVWALMA